MADAVISAEAGAVITELVIAAESKMTAMYDSDLEAAWQRQSERWRKAKQAAEDLLGHDIDIPDE